MMGLLDADMPGRIGFSRWTGLRELPALDEDRQSSRPGIYVVGDLADAPIIKGALSQGYETGRMLAETLGPVDPERLDVVVVGAGPAGAAAAIALSEAGRSYLVLERDAPFHTIDAFPKGKAMLAQPRSLPTPGRLWFEDAPKEELVARWREEVTHRDLAIRTGEEVEAIEGACDDFLVRTRDTAGQVHTHRARRVILAIGRRGTPQTLGVPGEDLPKVRTQLDDPAALAGRDVLVVGGGDSAVEAALASAEAGARVTLSHRRARLVRPRRRNRRRLEAAVEAGRIALEAPSRLARIEADAVVLEGPSGARRLPNDAVIVACGTRLPLPWLRGLGLRMNRDPRWGAVPWLLGWAAAIWTFYVLKTGRELFPFVPGWLGWMHGAVRVPVPWWPTADGTIRVLDGGFFGTLLYSLAILGFGIAAMRRHTGHEQRRRYQTLIAFQLVFLFGIPELLAPLVTSLPGKTYTIGVPWPLSLWSLAHEPAAWGWMIAGALVSFVAIPLYVWRHNLKFCSWMCGCGGLAETVGDQWRWLAPRGPLARRAESLGVGLLLLALPVTLLIVSDLWKLVGFRTWLDQDVTVQQDAAAIEAIDVPAEEGRMRLARAEVAGGALDLVVEKFDWDREWRANGWIREVRAGDRILYPEQVAEGHYRLALADLPDGIPVTVLATSSALTSASAFASGWYALMVDFWLASIVGVVLYPLLGNRVWCRFLCPLRAYMEILSRRFGRLAIRSNDRCISCGECTRYCQMGIDVQGFAQQELHFDNANSACIQCGICVEVCPMDVLELVDGRKEGLPRGDPDAIGPRW